MEPRRGSPGPSAVYERSSMLAAAFTGTTAREASGVLASLMGAGSPEGGIAVFMANCLVLLVALLLLTFSPITIDAPIELDQFALLLAGFVVLVALNAGDSPSPRHSFMMGAALGDSYDVPAFEHWIRIEVRSTPLGKPARISASHDRLQLRGARSRWWSISLWSGILRIS